MNLNDAMYVSNEDIKVYLVCNVEESSVTSAI